MIDRQRGNVLVLIIALIVVLGAAGGVGYWVWHRQHAGHAATSTSSQTSSSAGSSSSSSSQQTLATVCGNLVLGKGSENGTAGTIYWDAVLTNNSAYTCQLSGYPAAFMVDGQNITKAAVSNPLYSPTAVTLAAHGGQAHVVIGLPDPGAFSPGTVTCTDAASSKLQLYLPGLTTAVEGLFGESACPGFSVTALQPGA